MVYVLAILVIVLAAVLILAATRPPSFEVKRSLEIEAPPGRIYPLLADFHQWSRWSPYEKLDLAMQRSFSGAESGKGAVYAWEGNGKAGAGRMEIVEAAPERGIDIKLDFIRPFRANNRAAFAFTQAGDATRVTWSMQGAAPFVARLMGLFINMDRMIGKDFEQGLTNLKAAVEQ
ncbi:SRPBCC family protein [Labrys sp. KNU-23]|uniref:SRPBCC family protein n=1 Tax=Labrys sp. KNU-23 TaxID=2789216 RepID=UPI0011ECFAAB|nr:SRPBCC family protein [Labrys sp. KNU-23]QEN87298.1 SRPBCC family protein [Labrys sp. KNU-23]